jgi:two-component system response regulator FixJ
VTSKHRVCVVDDDPGVRRVTCSILESTGEFQCQPYASAEELLSNDTLEDISCVITDLKMPNIDGLELQRLLHERDKCLTLVVVSGHADISSAVKLLRQGAANILQKPFDSNELITTVREAVNRTLRIRDQWQRIEAAKANYEKLSEEERDVLKLLVAGVPNKAIPTQLCMSSRTFDRRKQSCMSTMQVASVVDLATLMARISNFDAMRIVDRYEPLETFPARLELAVEPMAANKQFEQ